jgi:hypothetical protein
MFSLHGNPWCVCMFWGRLRFGYWWRIACCAVDVSHLNVSKVWCLPFASSPFILNKICPVNGHDSAIRYFSWGITIQIGSAWILGRRNVRTSTKQRLNLCQNFWDFPLHSVGSVSDSIRLLQCFPTTCRGARGWKRCQGVKSCAKLTP